MKITKLAVAKWEVCEVGAAFRSGILRSGRALSEVGFCEVGSLRSGKKCEVGKNSQLIATSFELP